MAYRFTLIFCLLGFSIMTGAQNKSTHEPVAATKKSVASSPQSGTSAKGGSEKKAKVKDNISGIWRGYFVQTSFFAEDRYRFEVQLDKAVNNALRGVTYSYKTTVFYGKAEATGIYTRQTENVLLKEIKMVDLKMSDETSTACLMTCYLEYNKIGSVETLTGTYTSVSITDKRDCGSGRVYLEKTPTSDFYKEDFILKKENEARNNKTPKTTQTPRPPVTSRTPTPPATSAKKPVKPGAEQELIGGSKNAPIQQDTPRESEPKKPVEVPKPLPTPEVIQKRDNELVKTIYTSEKSIRIDLYDNGEIDGDRISVYHNKKQVVSNQLLTNKAISFTIDASEAEPVHEFVMVAENLGSIPPNTSLMIITAGDNRYELFITSTEQKNAVVKIIFKP